jgi:exonuclease VII large subunit
MERGFSVVTNSSGKIIRASANVKKGEKLCIRPLKGIIHSVVESTE